MIMTIPLIQIDDEVREMNAKELADYEQRQAVETQKEVDKLNRESARIALLARLGISAEEAALLLG